MKGPFDFGLIGHLESWEQAYRLMEQWRQPENGSLDREEIRAMYPWIPPREIFRIEAISAFDGRKVQGVYLETFIPPDSLNRSQFYANMERVRKAAKRASRLQAGTVTLGGFTSIVLEGNTDFEGENTEHCAFTTGNSLTAAYIVKGTELAASKIGLDLSAATLGVIGSTGDIGTAVCRYFAPKTAELLLCARNRRRLERQAGELKGSGNARIAPDVAAVLRQSDVVICVASTAAPEFDLELCQSGALVCDAGYPKNMKPGKANVHLFWGGMGRVQGGVQFIPAAMEEVYQLAKDGVGHGCLLESVLLAMEGRKESFSRGRGHIGVAQIEETWALAVKHGLEVVVDFT